MEIFGPRDEVLQRLRKASGQNGSVPMQRPVAVLSELGLGTAHLKEADQAGPDPSGSPLPRHDVAPRTARETLS